MPSVIDRIPKDRTKKEHIGSLDRVIWSDDEQPCSILALLDGKAVVIGEKSTRFVRGQVYRFYGKWAEGKHGPQFKADTFTRDQPHTRVGVMAYLTDICGGVGNKTAERLWDKYGPEAVRTLREQPATVAADGILTQHAAEDAAKELRKFAGLERVRVDLVGLFSGRGFPGKVVDHAIAKWGSAAPDVIRKDPYKLLTQRIAGCGWKRCDKLHAELSLPRDTLKRAVLAGWNSLREDRTGSTWLSARAVFDAIKAASPEVADPMRAVKLGIRAGVFRIIRNGAERWLAIGENARAEQRIADGIRRLLASESRWPNDLAASATDGDGLASAHQVVELTKATATAVGCFTGGPGTGKSYTIACLLRWLLAHVGEQKVAVAAPTGKAATRITEYMSAAGLGLKATTIHRLLEIGRNGHDGGGWGFQRHGGNPLDQRFVIVDESSMIDTNLMADLLDACADGTHLLFVGDPFQLAPVGHGCPLRDMLAAGLSQGELTEVRRNAGTIVRACAAIKAGKQPEPAARLDLDAADPINLRIVETASGEALDWIENLLRSMSRFHPVWDTQILVATNDKSEVSRKAVNERFGKAMNPDGRRVDSVPFAVGDKVICTTNSKLAMAVYTANVGEESSREDTRYYDNGPADEAYVANGELLRVVAVGLKGMILANCSTGQLLLVPKARAKKKADDADAEGTEATGGMGDFELAYGVTGHKSQGSQWPCVIVIADKAGGSVADRNWWYTTISRAEKACVIVGDRSAFLTQCRRETLTKRKTFLADLLKADPQPTKA